MYIGNVEITLREAIFSITIASLMTVGGFALSNYVEQWEHSNNLKFRQAAQIDRNDDEFAQALKTDIGNAFVFGKFKAVDAVSHEKLEGNWLRIIADYQRYTRHTRVVTHTVGTGKNKHTVRRTEVYYTWDTFKVQRKNSKKVNYSGKEFDFGTFSYDYVKRHHKTVGNGHNNRIVFTYYPTEFNASIFTNMDNGRLNGKNELMYEISLEDCYNLKIQEYGVTIFWIFWIILTVGAVVGFVVIENKWIED